MIQPRGGCWLTAALRKESEVIRQRPPVLESKTAENRFTSTGSSIYSCMELGMILLTVLHCGCRWASIRGKSAPISSAPCATRAPSLKQKVPWGPGAGVAWPWQQWCMVWSRPDTKRSWEKPRAVLVWLHAPFSVEELQGCETVRIVPADLHFFKCVRLCHNLIYCTVMDTQFPHNCVLLFSIVYKKVSGINRMQVN